MFKAKMRDGKRVSGAVPYGYYRKPEDKQTLYVDEASASVVRCIFQLTCDGMGATAIADTLSEDKVLIPSAYARQNHPEDCQCTNYHDPYTWNATTVGYILNRREYLGHTVLGKTTMDNFKTKRKRIANEDELLVFYNTHEARNFIRKVKADGLVECVMCWTDKGYGLVIKTTGRNLRETEKIAEILKEQYGE